MIRYVHGSEDSIDTDVFYVFDKMPDMQTCKIFCHTNPDENRNIIIVKDGQVVDCFIGNPDEVNNALMDTYHLHHQDFPLIVTKRYKRNIILKQIRATRGILSILSRTQYREPIKKALKANWSNRLECLNILDLTQIDFAELDKQKGGQDYLKVIAFQIGQGMGLLEGFELYTKSSISNQYPVLKDFLYRIEDPNISKLNDILHFYVQKLLKIEYQEEGKDIVFFPEYNKKYELRHEEEVS